MKIVINDCESKPLKPKALPPQGQEENRTKSSSLLLNLAKQKEPTGDVVSAKCGAVLQGGGLNTAFVNFHRIALFGFFGRIVFFKLLESPVITMFLYK